MEYRSALLSVCIALHGFAQGVTLPKPGESANDGRRTALAAIQRMITKSEASTRKRAKKISPKAPAKFVADRTILSDLCMGADQAEHDQIAEGVIICLVAVSRNAAELPLSRAYVALKEGKTLALPLLATMPAEGIKALKTDGTIGRNVWVGLYWAPKARSLDGRLFVDFSAKRVHFDADVAFPLPKSFGEGLVDKNPKHLVINFGAIKELIEREYPGIELTPAFLEEIKSQSASDTPAH